MDNSEKKLPTLIEMLRESRWAAGLTDVEMAKVESTVIERRIPAGTLICRKGEQVEHWFGVIDGLLKLSSDTESGKTASLAGVPPGGWFG